MTRSLIREHIFKLLFRLEFTEPAEMPSQVDLFFEDAFAEDDMPSTGADIPEADQEYIRDKYEKICANLEEIDQKISEASKGWSIARIGKVELSILRLGIYEMLYDDDIPVSVAIDQAVELTKRFGQDGSPSFVNGVLAAIAK